MSRHDTVLDAADIDRILTRIAHEILEVHKGAVNLTLIGIHTRGVCLARRIQSKIHTIEGIEIPTGDIDITLYRDDWTRISHHPIVQSTDISFSVNEKQIILVDDVLFTGRTIRAAMDSLIDLGRPKTIQLLVLIDRGHRELPIHADYVGKVLPTSKREIVQVHLREIDDTDEVLITEPGGIK